jgi:hypothetical protein
LHLGNLFDGRFRFRWSGLFWLRLIDLGLFDYGLWFRYWLWWRRLRRYHHRDLWDGPGGLWLLGLAGSNEAGQP